MIGPFCSINGTLVPIAEATVSMDDVNFQYGYGVYETLKVRNGVLFFADLHEQRLFHSAAVIGLLHALEPGIVPRWTRDLVVANGITNANIKQLLIGSPSHTDPEAATLSIMALNPLFPDRKLYQHGAKVITFNGERQWPQAKSLNMLTSTIAYRSAVAAGAYDALLVNRDGIVTEGTRTNLYAVRGSQVWAAPAPLVLEGVTGITLAHVLLEAGFTLIERAFTREDLLASDGCFLTSTSSKVMPVSRIDERSIAVPESIRMIMKAYGRFLDDYLSTERAETGL